MQNVKVAVEGDVVTLTFNKNEMLRDTGKSEIIATSNGWAPLADLENRIAINLTVCRKRGGAPWRVRGEVV